MQEIIATRDDVFLSYPLGQPRRFFSET